MDVNLKLLLDALKLLSVVDLKLQTSRFPPQHLLFSTNTDDNCQTLRQKYFEP